MYQNLKFLAIIPARKGSQRLPDKNIRELSGKPLIQWAIDAAVASEYIDSVLVTSDCPRVLALAEDLKVGFVNRPEHLCTSKASSSDVILHALSHVTEKYDYFVFLQPTSPLRTSQDIDDSISQMVLAKATGSVSVCKVDHSPLWCNTLDESNSMAGFIPEHLENKRSQDLPDYFRINGAIYIASSSQYITSQSFFTSETIAYRMPTERSVDIDELTDFLLAEAILNQN